MWAKTVAHEQTLSAVTVKAWNNLRRRVITDAFQAFEGCEEEEETVCTWTKLSAAASATLMSSLKAAGEDVRGRISK
ncbi:hypothetical protein JOB18_014759 [Solea senegalensis]|uniref:Uncharacterized protein n=1 Tax=Solea senegalensis TaxID=28829 RepID=A0AAV6RMN5_SOLSE|nr:hypothetical protein JOB18_014759 [Solea senegalensis]